MRSISDILNLESEEQNNLWFQMLHSATDTNKEMYIKHMHVYIFTPALVLHHSEHWDEKAAL